MELRPVTSARDLSPAICLLCFGSAEGRKAIEAIAVAALADLQGAIVTNADPADELAAIIDGIDRSSVVAMWVEADDGLAELVIGLAASTGRLLLGSPPGSRFRAPLEVVAARFGIPLVDNPDTLVGLMRQRVVPTGQRDV